MKNRYARLTLAALAVMTIAAAVLVSCTNVLGYTAVRGESSDPWLLALDMDPLYLADLVAEKLVVEIDWVEGCRPGEAATRQLGKWIERYTPGRAYEIVLSDEITRERWLRSREEGGAAELVSEFLDADPRPTDEQALFYALYVPFKQHVGDHAYGYASKWLIVRNNVPALVLGATVYRETVGENAYAWFSGNRLAAMTLQHEFAHQMGLVANYGHMMAADPSHCTNTHCVLAPPRGRTILANVFPALFLGRLPSTLCNECERDIAEVQKYWSAEIARVPEYRRELAGRYHKRLATRLLSLRYHGNEGRARELLSLAITAHPDIPQYHVAFADLASRLKDRTWAHQHLETAVGVSTPAEKARLASRFCKIGRYSQALDMLAGFSFDEANPADQSVAVTSRIWALAGSGRLDDALSVCREERRRCGDTLIRILLLSGDANGAVDELGRVRDRRWPRRQRLLLEALTLARAGHEVEAQERTAEVIRLAEPDLLSQNNETSLRARIDIALAHAIDGDDVQALASVDATLAPRTVVRVQAITNHVESALEMLEDLSLASSIVDDPCLDVYLERLRTVPSFYERRPECSALESQRGVES